MSRILVGGGAGMITEIRREPPVFPAVQRRWMFLAIGALFLAVALFTVWMSGRYYRIGYAVSRAVGEHRMLEKERMLLKTEILTLRSPARIEAIARNQLGMVDPRTDRILQVK
ncbi:MAG TPA: cell division protein FtsL [Candidatus Deferrimicrobiaceae bacterium]